MGYKGHVPATFYGDSDIHLDSGKGVIYWIQVKAKSASAALSVRDGSDDDADIILDCEVQTQRAVVYRYDPPQPYERGLYIDPDTNVSSFTIAYDHLES